MNPRHAQLLYGLVSRHIATGHPIGSRELTNYLNIRLSPATVRSALLELDEAGYLFQPHTSAGRVPTDLGYRFYVDSSKALALHAREQRRIQAALRERYRELQQRAAAKILAELTRTVAVAVAMQPRDIREAGMNDLLEQLRQDEMATAREVSALVEAVEEDAPKLAEEAVDHTVVYIGAENPLLKARYTSLIVRQASLPDGSRALIMIAGPKRMQYQRNRALLEYIVDHLN